MAYSLANHHNIPSRLSTEGSNGFIRLGQDRKKLTYCRGRQRNAGRSGKTSEQPRHSVKVRGFTVHNSTSAAAKRGPAGTGKIATNAEGQFGCLVNEYGWRVRRLVETADEMRKAAYVQAEAFYEPVALFNYLFFQFFQAEVLSGLVYKLRNSPPSRYACLVAEPITNAIDSEKQLVGVVDATVLRDKAVLKHLPAEVEEYLYLSGIAVLKTFRRQKIARVLLKACDVLSILWGFEYIVLWAYEDDLGARKLYTSAGYEVVSGDPAWMTTWIGRKRRVLMIKRSNIVTRQEEQKARESQQVK